MARCSNCGKENPDPICASCMHYKKKEAERHAAREGAVAPPKPPKAPDLDELRDRLQRIQDGLAG